MIRIIDEELKIRKSRLGLLNKYLLLCNSYGILKVFKKINHIIFHLELPLSAYRNRIRMGHPFNIIVNGKTKIGKNITLYQNVTIGSKQWGGKQGVFQTLWIM